MDKIKKDYTLMEDCRFYNTIRRACTALRETYCKKEDCSFYKPIDKNNTVKEE